jgi:hypothetical protein
MKPIAYLSGYCNGLLPPTIPPHGAGVSLPDRSQTRSMKAVIHVSRRAARSVAYAPHSKILLPTDASLGSKRHFADGVRAVDMPEPKEPDQEVSASYEAALERARAGKVVL